MSSSSYIGQVFSKDNPEFKDIYIFHGKSAYQAAVEQGYVGTEEQWILSLKDLRFGTYGSFQDKESTVIYIDIVSNNIYRYDTDKDDYIAIGGVLGETENTAYRGDRGKIAYDHAMSDHNYVHKTGGEMTGDLKGTNAIYSGNVTSEYFISNKDVVINNTQSHGLKLRRDLSDKESVLHNVSDNKYMISYQNNDKASYIIFTMNNTDTTNGNTGTDANTSTVTFTGNKNGSTVEATKFKGTNLEISGTSIFNDTITTKNIIPSAANKYDLGSSTLPFSTSYASTFRVFKSNYQYSLLHIPSEGTISTTGLAQLILGNDIASGTAGNAKGGLVLYGTNSGTTQVYPGYNGTDNVILNLPSSGGTLALTTDNVASATKLQTARTITLTGAITGSIPFDGTSDVTIETTRNHSHPASEINESATRRFITDEERAAWNAKPTQAEMTKALEDMIGAAPGTLDTLEEIAKALGEDPNFSATMTQELAKKLNLTGGTMTGQLTSKNIIPSADITYNLGSSSEAYSATYTRYLYIYSGGVDYGNIMTRTVGTTTTQGEGGMVLGNSRTSGTDGNARGAIYLYGTNTGHTRILPGYNSTSNITLTLPSSAGTIALTTDNVASATKLATARTINGTSFDGSANITTANWGTARTITIGNTGKSVNGSEKVSWSLAEIGAVNKAGDIMTGSLQIGSNSSTNLHLDSGGTVSINLSTAEVGWARGLWYNYGGENIGSIGIYGNKNVISYAYIGLSHTNTWMEVTPDSNVIATTFTGSLVGNAATATKLATARTINGTSFDGSANITTANWGTARTITIGNTGKSVNGSEKVSWSLAEIGAAAASHTHSYLPLSGGTMTGALTVQSTISCTSTIACNGGLWGPCIEFGNMGSSAGHGGYLDFHFNGSSADYTTRIIEGASGVLTCSGTFSATKLYNAVWNDYAEWYEREDITEELEPGDILTWGENGVTKTTTEADSMVVGVYSDSYGHIIGGEQLDNMEDNIKKFAPVGLNGRLYVKVNGTVKKGDLIISSDIPGVGIAVNRRDAESGTIVGKALENKTSSDIGKIKIAIMLS